MTRDEAAVCFARLVAHWPRLGGTATDPLAASRAADWIRSLSRLTTEGGMAAVDVVIGEHREQRLPVFGDVQDAARQVARRRDLERPRALSPAPGRRLSKAELDEILAPARAVILQAAHEQKVGR